MKNNMVIKNLDFKKKLSRVKAKSSPTHLLTVNVTLDNLFNL